MDISTAYKQHQQVNGLLNQIAEVAAEIRKVDFAYHVAFIGTFVLYFCFIWGMYVADLWGFTTWLTNNISEFVALAIYGVLAGTLPLTMALIKEIAYRHFSNYPNSKMMMVLIVGILALAGVLYESITSSSQQQHMSFSSAENSKTFQAIAQTTTTAEAGTGGYAGRIASQQQIVARCEVKLAAGKEKHCDGDKAKLNSLLESEARLFESNERASVAGISAKTAAIAELKEDQHKPVFKAIRDSFDVSINTGIMIVTIFVSAIFEISHLLLIMLLAQKKQRLMGLNAALINAESDYMRSTGKTFKAEDFSDDSVLDMNEVREKSPIGFGSPAMAFKYQTSTAKQPAGFIQTDKLTPSAQSTWNKTLAQTGINSPSDPAMNQSADQAQIGRIVNAGLASSGSARQLGIPSASSPLDDSLKAVADSLYSAWKGAVLSGDCSHAKAATQKFIWKHSGTDSQTLTANETAHIWNDWKGRAVNDSVLVKNPEYAKGNRKPEFVLS